MIGAGNGMLTHYTAGAGGVFVEPNMVVKFKLEGKDASSDLGEIRIIRLKGEKVDLSVDDSDIFADLRGIFHKDDEGNSKPSSNCIDLTIAIDDEGDDEKENCVDLTSD